ncbi:MAG: ATP-binding cassette domain-containing protein, partial [Verrucomicrobiota bacterium]
VRGRSTGDRRRGRPRLRDALPRPACGIDAFKIKTPGMRARVGDLSGGNQQKVLLARWLAADPKTLILDEPTRGIDVGARAEIEKLIEDLSVKGLSILMISSEMDEEVRCCHRVLVLRDREIIGELQGKEISEQSIVSKIAAHRQEATA